MASEHPDTLLSPAPFLQAIIALLRQQFPDLNIGLLSQSYGRYLQLKVRQGRVLSWPNDSRSHQLLYLSLLLSDDEDSDNSLLDATTEIATLITGQCWGWRGGAVGEPRRIEFLPLDNPLRPGWEIQWQQPLRLGQIEPETLFSANEMMLAINPLDADNPDHYQPLEV